MDKKKFRINLLWLVIGVGFLTLGSLALIQDSQPKDEQGILHYKELAEKTGFEILSEKEDEKWFFLELKKTGT